MSGQCPVFDIIVKEQVIMSKFDRLFITASAELLFCLRWLSLSKYNRSYIRTIFTSTRNTTLLFCVAAIVKPGGYKCSQGQVLQQNRRDNGAVRLSN